MPIVNPGGSGGGGTVTAAQIEATFTATGQIYQGTGSGTGHLVLPPGYEISYTQATGAVTVASTTEATGTTVLSPAAATFDGGLVLAHFFCPRTTSSTVTGNTLTVSLFESTTQICRLGLQSTVATGTQILPFNAFYRFTPTAGSHTYTVTAFSSNANDASFVPGAGGTSTEAPMFIRFTKV